eukprot:3962915-Pleurochrysis_carterae.AAC.1
MCTTRTTQNWMVTQSLRVNFTTITKSTTCCCSALQRDTTCSLPTKLYLWIQKLAGYGLLMAKLYKKHVNVDRNGNDQAFRRSKTTKGR